MSTLMSQLLTPPARKPLAANERLALEYASMEAEQLVNDDLSDIVEAQQAHSVLAVDIDKGEQLNAGLDVLLNSAINDYSTSGMSPEAADLFRLSVESLFKASGMNVDLSQVITSFESATPTSTGVRVKGHVSGMMSQIGEMLGSLMARLREIALTVVAKLRTSRSSLTGYLDAIDNKLKRITKETVSNAEVSVGGIGDFLMDRSDRFGKPDVQIATNADLYGDFMIEWENHWRPLLSMVVPTAFREGSTIVAFNGHVTDLAKKAVTKPGLDIRFILSHHVEITPGNGTNPLLGAGTEINQSSKAKSDKAPTLTRAEIRHGLETARSAIKVLEAAERKIDQLVSNSQRFSQAVKRITVNTDSESDASMIRETLRAMGKASTLASDGYLTTLPVYMRALKANVRYIELSVNEYL